VKDERWVERGGCICRLTAIKRGVSYVPGLHFPTCPARSTVTYIGLIALMGEPVRLPSATSGDLPVPELDTESDPRWQRMLAWGWCMIRALFPLKLEKSIQDVQDSRGLNS